VIPEEWIETSTTPVSLQPEDADLLENEIMEGYAYLWWVDTDENTFWADGSGGQFLIVDQQNDLVVALRNNTGLSPASYVLYSATERFEDNIQGNEVYKFIRSKIAQ
jgi:CubicO group peptidase (beta-lactamase class C family)